MTCSVDGCAREVCSRGLCRKHYDMVRYHGRIVRPVQRKKLCFVCGSWMEVRGKDKDFCSARCRMRYMRLRRKGGVLPTRGKNRVISSDEVFDRVVEEPVPMVAQFSNRDVLDASDGVCVECGNPIGPDDVIGSGWLLPLEAGGLPVLANRVPLHSQCRAKWEVRSPNGRARKARK